jgi:hypothetical protein
MSRWPAAHKKLVKTKRNEAMAMKMTRIGIGVLMLLLSLNHPISAQLLRRTADYDFPAKIESDIGGRQISLVRTGEAIRFQGRIQVYAVASYVQEGVPVRSAEELVAADCAKQMHLFMLRYIPSIMMAQAFESTFRANHPVPAFADEVKRVLTLFRSASVRPGVHVWLTHIPEVGLQCLVDGQEPIIIESVEFSRAVWENYFGRYNVGEAVKEGLLSGLDRDAKPGTEDQSGECRRSCSRTRGCRILCRRCRR